MNHEDPEIFKQIDAQIAEDAKLNDLSEEIKRQYPDIQARSVNLELNDEDQYSGTTEDENDDPALLHEADCQFEEQQKAYHEEPENNVLGKNEFSSLLSTKGKEEKKQFDWLKLSLFVFSVFMLSSLFLF